jgi:hypothetical protein
MCQQKNSDEASPREEVACLDCPLTKIQPEMCSQGLIELSTITNGWTNIGVSLCSTQDNARSLGLLLFAPMTFGDLD